MHQHTSADLTAAVGLVVGNHWHCASCGAHLGVFGEKELRLVGAPIWFEGVGTVRCLSCREPNWVDVEAHFAERKSRARS